MAIELIGLDAWIVSTLSADATIASACASRIYADFAPLIDPAGDGTSPPPTPFIVFNLLSAPDTLGSGARRVLNKPLVRLSVIGEGGYGPLAPVADAMDALLQASTPLSLSVNGQSYTLLGLYRERALQWAEVSNGVRFSHLGGEYRAVLQAN